VTSALASSTVDALFWIKSVKAFSTLSRLLNSSVNLFSILVFSLSKNY
jgi:hypothetical protein